MVNASRIATGTNAESLALLEEAASPVLIQLTPRPVGPCLTVSVDAIESALAGTAPEKIAVVRDSFTPYTQPIRLRTLVKKLQDGAVATAINQRTVLVDTYTKSDNGIAYRLTKQGCDLLSLLHNEEGHGKYWEEDAATRRSCPVAAQPRGTSPCSQATSCVLMVAPTAFEYNSQAAGDNKFMKHIVGDEVTHHALKEFGALFKKLVQEAGIRVELFEHTREMGTPDAIFPNNWFSTHGAGETGGPRTLVLYPMKCPNRRRERRRDVIQHVVEKYGVQRVVDLTHYEQQGMFLEGTGALVLDRLHSTAYCCLSERAHESAVQEWATELGYKHVITFKGTDRCGCAIYHTNVVMAVGTGWAVWCSECVEDEHERQRLRESLGSHGRELIDITLSQVDQFCGNILELRGATGQAVCVMSSRAYHAFNTQQLKCLQRHTSQLLHVDFETIEDVGGGGVRCALAELF